MPSTSVSLTILVDNHAGDGLTAEHGLSLWIETGGKRILFDTGQGPALESNARRLGIPLETTDVLVLSHGHYDHTGGIPHLIECSPTVDVYCHPGIMQPRYSISDGTARPVDMPRAAQSAFSRVPLQRIHWVTGPSLVSDAIGLTGPIPHETLFEDTGGPFYLDPDGTYADPLDDDIALWIRTKQGLVVCAGCSHAGIVNTLNTVQRLNQGERIRAVIGGFHLINATRERLEQTVAALRRIAPDLIIPCHCTGTTATDVLRNALGERVSPGAAGMTVRF